MLIQKRLNLNPKQQEIFPSEPVRRETIPSTQLAELLDEFMKLSGYNQSEPNDWENYKEESSPLLLITSNAERQGHYDKIQKELKCLKEVVTSVVETKNSADSWLLPEE